MRLRLTLFLLSFPEWGIRTDSVGLSHPRHRNLNLQVQNDAPTSLSLLTLLLFFVTAYYVVFRNCNFRCRINATLIFISHYYLLHVTCDLWPTSIVPHCPRQCRYNVAELPTYMRAVCTGPSQNGGCAFWFPGLLCVS